MVERFAGFCRAEVSGVPVLWSEDSRFKTFRVGVHARRPLDGRAAARSLLPGLLLLGTTRAPDRPSLARRMDELYGASAMPGTSKIGETHAIQFTLDAVAGRFLPDRPDQCGAGMAVLADYLVRPRLDGDGFPAESFERERRQAESAVRALIDDKAAYAQERALGLACEGEPMAIPEHGGLERIVALDCRDPESARRDLLRHGQMWVVAMGSLDGAVLVDRVAAFLAELPPREPEPIAGPIAVAERPSREIVERAALQQSKLALVFRTPPVASPDQWLARRLFVSLLGGGPHSRLFREVRERHSLAYYAQAGLDHHKGLVVVQIGLEEVNADRASGEVMRQLRALQAGEFDDRELDTARAGIVSTLRAIDDSIAQRCAYTSERWLTGVDRAPDEQARRYLEITRDEVTAAGQGIWLDLRYLLAPGGEEGAA